MRSKCPIKATSLTAAIGLVVACSDTNSPNDADLVDVTFGIQRDAGTSAQVVQSVLFSQTSQNAAIEPDTVASLLVTVESIQVLPLLNENEEEDDAAWVTVELDQSVAIDLATLPLTSDPPLVLASGSLPEGSYTNVRLFVGDAFIVFKGPLSLGVAITFDPDTEYPVTIPSVEQTGIKTDMSFQAQPNTEVTLVFDETASYSNVTLTGNGQVILAPVIRSQGN